MTSMWYAALAFVTSLALVGAQEHPSSGAHHHPEAAKQIYEKNCANCHGKTGTGDGAMGAELNPKPANLVDADWKHGSSDGEIFEVIKDGVKGTGMKSFN